MTYLKRAASVYLGKPRRAPFLAGSGVSSASTVKNDFYTADVHIGRLQKLRPEFGVNPALLVGQRVDSLTNLENAARHLLRLSAEASGPEVQAGELIW